MSTESEGQMPGAEQPAEQPTGQAAGQAARHPKSSIFSFHGPVIGMIWAQTERGVIGRDGTIPWRAPADMAHFKRVTTGHPVIMGRRTWESFPAKYRPLPDRTNIVITTRQGWAGTPKALGAVVVHSLEDALVKAQASAGSNEVWIIGGGHVYTEALEHANVAAITLIDSDTGGDTFAPALGPEWTQHSSSPHEGWLTERNGTRYRFTQWGKDGTGLHSPEG